VKTVPERLKKTRATQVEKYGGEEGFRAEMKRRRSMMKSKTGFAMMTPEKIVNAQLKSAKKRKENARNKKH
jgi:hypothetical protein